MARLDDEGPERDLAPHGRVAQDRHDALLALAQMRAGLGHVPPEVAYGLIRDAALGPMDPDVDGDFLR